MKGCSNEGLDLQTLDFRMCISLTARSLGYTIRRFFLARGDGASSTDIPHLAPERDNLALVISVVEIRWVTLF